jgi:hypothetical protein
MSILFRLKNGGYDESSRGSYTAGRAVFYRGRKVGL